jgi:CheY-like chemotaxis protein
MTAGAKRSRVLIVDDSDTVRKQAGQMLEAEFDCLFARDGLDALRVATNESPDAMIADLEMPGMDGVELLRRVRGDKHLKTLPVIIVTTVTDVEKVNVCRGLGCSGFVLKPLQQEYLVAKLRQVINARGRAPAA